MVSVSIYYGRAVVNITRWELGLYVIYALIESEWCIETDTPSDITNLYCDYACRLFT